MMQITINNKKYPGPSSLGEITLQMVLDFHNQYGKDIETFQINSDLDDELMQMEIRMDLACKSVAFFFNIPLDIVYKTDLNQIISIFQNVISPIFEQKQERTLQDQYYFKDFLWTIQSPKMDNQNQMSFIELILGKEITRDLKNFANGKLDVLQRLSAIYLRKTFRGKTEEFQEDWINEDSERLQMMAELPMDIVLDVAFFLQSSMSSFLSTSLFSQNPEVSKMGQI